MMREMGVQMDVGLGFKCENTGVYTDTRKDKIIRPNKNYFSSTMWAKEREDTTENKATAERWRQFLWRHLLFLLLLAL